MTNIHIELGSSGGPDHQADLARFRAQGLPVPHSYRHSRAHKKNVTRKWVRALDSNWQFICAFMVELAPSRAVPGMRIGKVERLGRSLHQQGSERMGEILAETSKKIDYLLRLDVQVFDEHQAQKGALIASIARAGGKPVRQYRRYRHTLMLDVSKPDDALMRTLSARTRRSIRKCLQFPSLEVRPIRSASHTSRMLELYAATFARTSAKPHAFDVNAMFADLNSRSDSILFGAFSLREGHPEELVAFACARMQGDHAVYERAASVRIPGENSIVPGAALMWNLLLWARNQGADWFDFGGIIPADAPSDHPLQGIATFKRGFSGIECEISAEFSFEPMPFLTAAARLERKVARKLKLGQAWSLLQQLY